MRKSPADSARSGSAGDHCGAGSSSSIRCAPGRSRSAAGCRSPAPRRHASAARPASSRPPGPPPCHRSEGHEDPRRLGQHPGPDLLPQLEGGVDVPHHAVRRRAAGRDHVRRLPRAISRAQTCRCARSSGRRSAHSAAPHGGQVQQQPAPHVLRHGLLQQKENRPQPDGTRTNRRRQPVMRADAPNVSTLRLPAASASRARIPACAACCPRRGGRSRRRA